MAIYLTAYDTTIGSSENTNNIKLTLKEAFISDMIYEKNLNIISSENFRLCFITGSDRSEENIPQIIYPILYEHSVNNNLTNFLCSDLRLFVNPREFDAYSNNPKVKNISEYNLIVDRAILTSMWLDGKQDKILADFDFGGTVYASWLTDVVAKRYALDGRDQLMFTILAYTFYVMLFIEDTTVTNDIKEMCSIKLLNKLRIPRQLIDEVYANEMSLIDIHSFCETVKSILKNIRLDYLNLGIFVTLIGNSWYGVNHEKILSVAVEHPPTWLSLLYGAMNDRGFRNTAISKTAERLNKRGEGSTFLNNYKSLVGPLRGLTN